MAAIHDLINQIDDLLLRDRLLREWQTAIRDRKFGLVFEEHLPELLPLPKARPRRGDPGLQEARTAQRSLAGSTCDWIRCSLSEADT